MAYPWFDLADGRIVYEQRGPDRYLASIDAYWALLTSQGAQALKNVPRLRVLGLSGQHFPTFKIDADKIQQLIDFGGVEELRLNGAALPSEIVRMLFSSLSDLDSVDARGVALDSIGLESLINNSPNLRKLQVGSTVSRSFHRFPYSALSFSTLNKLAELKALDSLAVRGLPLSTDELVSVISSHNLVSLDCGETNLTTDALQRLSLRHLSSLDADLCRLDENCGRVLASEYPYLAHLNLSGNPIGDIGINALTSLEGIRSLKLSRTEASDASADAISRLEILESLDLSDNSLSSAAVKRIAENSPQLRELRVSRVEPDSMEVLRNIDRLYISGSGSEAFYDALQSVSGVVELTANFPPGQRQSLPSNLKKLTVNSPIDPASLGSIFQSSSIEMLFIQTEGGAYTQLKDSDLLMLRDLYAPAQGLTDDSMLRLAARPRLEALYISDNPLISDVGVSHLAESKHLHTLELRNTVVSNQVIDTLVALPSLHCLDVPGTGVSADAVAGLGNANVLQSLALDPTQITLGSISGLARLETLIELYVYGNATSQQLGFLQELPHLHELVLFGMSDDPALAPAIASIETLRQLSGDVGVNLAAALIALRPDLMINGRRAVMTSAEPFREGRFPN
jgi:hypothetical protein